MASVFLSYDHEDAARAAPIASALEKAGHSVWWDRHIHGGAQYNSEIERAVEEADAVVVLWSPRSIQSAWVRDEAAEGRDRGKLVPVTVDGVKPPMGFRQFQAIDLSDWKGRKPPPRMGELLHAIEKIASGTAATTGAAAAPAPRPSAGRLPHSRLIVAGTLALFLILGAGIWLWIGRGALPVVVVAAADASPKSQTAASDLFVKLGSLAEVGKGKWQLVDATAAPSRPDLVFRTADIGSSGEPQAHLLLLDGSDDTLLWSREFSFPAGREADLRQQLAMTAGRVLRCALEGQDAGGLRRDLLKLFLNACSFLAETSAKEPKKGMEALRSIVAADPDFKPAWAHLILADMNVAGMEMVTGEQMNAMRTLRADVATVRKIAPELPELALAELMFLPATAYGQRLDLVGKAASRAPENTQVLADQSSLLMSVGRMNDALTSARRAAELDPLSPAATTQLILTLAYGGQTKIARQELARAERLWAGTGALRDALWAFHLRFGDPEIARKYAGFSDPGLDLYLDARANPSPANVRKMVAHIRKHGSQPGVYVAAFAPLAEFDQIDEAFGLIAKHPTEMVAEISYLLFRPAAAGLRRDPRFMRVAMRLGLVEYWRKSGKWPDFCFDAVQTYDCKAEAAKIGT